MSLADQKQQAPVYALIVIMGMGSYFLGNSDDAITVDKIIEIQNDIIEIKGDIKNINDILNSHKAEGAHSQATEAISNLQKLVDKLDDRVRNIELFGTKKLQ